MPAKMKNSNNNQKNSNNLEVFYFAIW